MDGCGHGVFLVFVACCSCCHCCCRCLTAGCLFPEKGGFGQAWVRLTEAQENAPSRRKEAGSPSDCLGSRVQGTCPGGGGERLGRFGHAIHESKAPSSLNSDEFAMSSNPRSLCATSLLRVKLEYASEPVGGGYMAYLGKGSMISFFRYCSLPVCKTLVTCFY